ncbi:MAG TPA: hypothetical protein VFC58_01050 [Desulfosporosinus sp.]|nr:hypothetical protein [Desulfosporosinus sp.]
MWHVWKADPGTWGFGFIHSTPRTGKPATWGRDGQKYAACKGNQRRICWIGSTLANLPAGNSKEGIRKQKSPVWELISTAQRRITT